MINITNGNCLQEMPKLPRQSIDLVLTDLPYGLTQNKADLRLPLNILWSEWKRLLKPTGTIVLTSQFPFTVELYNSNPSWFGYDLIWDKILTSNPLNAKRQPMKVHEQILVFYNKLGVYNPQKTLGARNHTRGSKPHKALARRNYGEHKEVLGEDKLLGWKYPTSIIKIQKPHASIAFHPTEKPVELAEWIVKTYTNQGDTVLDCCMGVGWSAIACMKLDRSFWGFDINLEYINQAKERLAKKKAEK